jgi:AcrR family transcriptional regulator
VAETAVATLPSRRERRRLEIRERVLEVARSLFETQGYEATTVSQICDRADIAYGTFFNHFPSKLDLLRDLSDLALRDLFQTVEEVAHGPGHFGDRLVRLFEDAAERAEAMGPRPRELMSAMMTLAFPESAVTDDRRVRQAFRLFLEAGRKSGDVRPDVEIDTLVDVVVGSWYAMFLSWVHFEDYPLRERVSAAAKFLATTLTAPDGVSHAP